MKVTQSSPTLCDPMDYIVCGILQARILECVAFPFSRGSSQPRDRTQVSHINKTPKLPLLCIQFSPAGSPPHLSLSLFSPRAIHKVTFPHHLHILTFYSLSSPCSLTFAAPTPHCQILWRVCNLYLVGLSDAFEMIESFLFRGSLIIWCLWQCTFLFLLLRL